MSVAAADSGFGRQQLDIAGIRVDRLSEPEVLSVMREQITGSARPPLGVGSVNLDHVHHFGAGRRRHEFPADTESGLRWLMLIDGSPVARLAGASTGLAWPRVTGSDLLPAVLALAAETGTRVGFLGGFAETVPLLKAAVSRRWPTLAVAGHWTPTRATVDDHAASQDLAAEIRGAGVDLLVVGLGKPRQEKWMDAHGVATGARLLTAFGAAADFVAGSARRAPVWMRQAGIEWTYRLVNEPRRLSRRYLVQGPVALWRIHRTPLAISYLAPRPETGPPTGAPAVAAPVAASPTAVPAVTERWPTLQPQSQPALGP